MTEQHPTNASTIIRTSADAAVAAMEIMMAGPTGFSIVVLGIGPKRELLESSQIITWALRRPPLDRIGLDFWAEDNRRECERVILVSRTIHEGNFELVDIDFEIAVDAIEICERYGVVLEDALTIGRDCAHSAKAWHPYLFRTGGDRDG